MRDASPERILQLRVVDPAMGSGAFLVAACRYLAAAYEAALVRTGAYHGSDFGARERVATRRTIAERCLYGVDLNPMAVQLARLSLWLATLAADRPLTFLDHHLQTGDSLLGAWLSSLRRPPIPNRGRRARQDAAALPLFAGADVAEALRAALPIRFSLEETPGDTIDQVRAKESALAALGRRDAVLAKWKRVADLWCAVWFTASTDAVPPPSFSALADLILTGTRCAAAKARGRVPANRRHHRGVAPPVSLGARVSRGVLRRRRREQAGRRLRRGDRQSALGHASGRRRIGRRPRSLAIRGIGRCCGSRAMPASTRRSRTVTRTDTSSLSSARWR